MKNNEVKESGRKRGGKEKKKGIMVDGGQIAPFHIPPLRMEQC